MPKLVLLVEGHGDVAAAPLLVRRTLAAEQVFDIDIIVQRRSGLDALCARDYANFRRYLRVAALEKAPVLLLIDCDDGCAWDHAHRLTTVAASEGVPAPFGVAFWVREFETMFLYDFETLMEVMQLRPDAAGPENPGDVRDAKAWIDRCLPRGRIYKERLDQPRLTARVRLERLEERYRSFQHFLKVLRWLIAQNGPVTYPIAAWRR